MAWLAIQMGSEIRQHEQARVRNGCVAVAGGLVLVLGLLGMSLSLGKVGKFENVHWGYGAGVGGVGLAALIAGLWRRSVAGRNIETCRAILLDYTNPDRQQQAVQHPSMDLAVPPESGNGAARPLAADSSAGDAGALPQGPQPRDDRAAPSRQDRGPALRDVDDLPETGDNNPWARAMAARKAQYELAEDDPSLVRRRGNMHRIGNSNRWRWIPNPRPAAPPEAPPAPRVEAGPGGLALTSGENAPAAQQPSAQPAGQQNALSIPLSLGLDFSVVRQPPSNSVPSAVVTAQQPSAPLASNQGALQNPLSLGIDFSEPRPQQSSNSVSSAVITAIPESAPPSSPAAINPALGPTVLDQVVDYCMDQDPDEIERVVQRCMAQDPAEIERVVQQAMARDPAEIERVCQQAMALCDQRRPLHELVPSLPQRPRGAPAPDAPPAPRPSTLPGELALIPQNSAPAAQQPSAPPVEP
jgi:hypothetical protein